MTEDDLPEIEDTPRGILSSAPRPWRTADVHDGETGVVTTYRLRPDVKRTTTKENR